MKWKILIIPAVLMLLSCAGGLSPGDGAANVSQMLTARDVEQPTDWDKDLALPTVIDLNPDPDILEINLEAYIQEMEIIPGTMTPVWTYNGGLPGPLIKTKVGDRVIIHFTNSLPDSTSIHWHGIRVPNNMDGVPGMTQDPVEPGGQFTYDFVVRDAGTYWYHPHINSAAQVGWGLYGPFIVEDPSDPEEFGEDLVLMLSDMSLDAQGQFLPADSGGAFGDLFGREGEVLLVNGKVLPTLKLRKGKQQRWRIINAARSRYYSIRYKRTPMTKLGGDNGLAARSEVVDEVIVTPSERADLVFTPSDEPGTAGVLQWYPTDRGYGSTFNRFSEPMLNLETVSLPAVNPVSVPVNLRTIEPVDISDAKQVEMDLTIDFDRDNNVVMGINGIPFWELKPIIAKVGETQIWNVKNYTDFDHPFHLHGYFFQVLDENRIPEWKDTVNVPVNSEVKIAVRFDERPGMWMYHCHILDHAESGMMGHIQILP